ncbi:unnamed protein product [Nezara viridula]|uniref:O-phosphoseryl-tRNA(Sec) selenium transferase n=1 Tax=Nezara viridula TaxID=85310 RepID=A0A9P0HMI9_NEZVI|nr:unnamed protein product [Nezara viridula]
MNPQCFSSAEKLIPSTYVQQAIGAKRSRENQIRILIEQRKWPDEGWDEATIESFLYDLANMDSNNFPSACGVGAREARFACELVARRNYRMGHGIGRSGDIGEVQPKAAGSSLLTKLTNALLLDVIRFMGVKNSAGCFMVPLATGMSLVLCMLTIKQERPGAKFVLWSRVDQKSCFKSILTCGLQPIIVEPVPNGDELRTDIHGIEAQINTLGSSNIVCVLSTTSCYAPRSCDSLEHIAAICARHDVPHVVNNAFGLQSARLMHLITEAARKGRIDAFVQSTDKNLLVPVGGSVISGFDKALLERISRNYAGRASAGPIMDIFITLLWLGSNGYRKMIMERKEMFKYLREEIGKVAAKHGEHLLETRNNPLSVAMTLTSLTAGGDSKRAAMLHTMLFMRDVSGAAIVTGCDHREIGPYTFDTWGTHNTSSQNPYISTACGVGMKKEDVDLFCFRLDLAINKLKNKPVNSLSPPTIDEMLPPDQLSRTNESGDQEASANLNIITNKRISD